MQLIDVETLQKVDFNDMGEYISKYEKLKVLRKPILKEGTSSTIYEPYRCFGSFMGNSKCELCERVQRSICVSVTNLKKLEARALKPEFHKI